MAMHELFSPQGSNPLALVKLTNPRCGKVEFERAVRSNVLTIDGDLTQSRLQVPREDRPLSSLQLHHSLLILQILIPSSGQFLLELTVSHSTSVRMKLSAATFIARADVVDAKGMPHAKIPLVIPRNSWVQIVFNIGGIFTHLFNLPPVKWIDTVVLAGCCKVRRMMSTGDEVAAIESKPSGMLLFAVPAYGPPVWQTANVKEDRSQQQQQQQQAAAAAAAAAAKSRGQDELSSGGQIPRGDAPHPATDDGGGDKEEEEVTTAHSPLAVPPPKRAVEADSATATAKGGARDEVSTRVLQSKELLLLAQTHELAAAAHAAKSPQGQFGKYQLQRTQQVASKAEDEGGVDELASSGSGASPVKMRFTKGNDGSVQFTAKDPVAEAKAEELRLQHQRISDAIRAEAAKTKEREGKLRDEQMREAEINSYVRLVDEPPLPQGSAVYGGPPPVSSRRPSVGPAAAGLQPGGEGATNSGRKASQQPRTPPSMTGMPNFDESGGVGAWGDVVVNSARGTAAAVQNATQQRTGIAAGGRRATNSSSNIGGALASPTAVSMGGSNALTTSSSFPQSGPAASRVKPKPRATAAPSHAASAQTDPMNSTMTLLSSVVNRAKMLSEVHPADSYDPTEWQRTKEPDVGYGCGCLEIIHDERLDVDEEEDDGDEDDVD